ncbi:MAG: hypothetical protein ACI8RD_014660, partial [Bacillariaceae sp.]
LNRTEAARSQITNYKRYTLLYAIEQLNIEHHSNIMNIFNNTMINEIGSVAQLSLTT